MGDAEKRLDIKWLKTLYSLGVGADFRAEVMKMLREQDLLNRPEWPEIRMMGHELLPEDQLFAAAAEKASEPEEDRVIPEPVSRDVDFSSIPKGADSELAKFRRMSSEPGGSRFLLAKIFVELGDYASARPLLNEIFNGDNPEYKKAAKELLDEILAEEGGKDRLIAQTGKVPDTTAKYRAFNDLSQRFQMLSDDEVSQRLVLAQIYLELGDTLKAKGNVAEVIEEGSHNDEANRYLQKAISDEIDDLGLITMILKDSGVKSYAGNTGPESDDNQEIGQSVPDHQAIRDVSDRFRAIVGNDNAEKFALAQLYVGMGEYASARMLITEITESKDTDYLVKAKKLLDQIILEEDE